MDLPEFLGMTEDVYRAWLQDPTDIPVRYLTCVIRLSVARGAEVQSASVL
jgi:hypothetical protein